VALSIGSQNKVGQEDEITRIAILETAAAVLPTVVGRH
jgi:hypothetical protein